jgi:hypothetical protein
MAFVYDANRWIEPKLTNYTGPGQYDLPTKSKPKCGVISPDHKSHQ